MISVQDKAAPVPAPAGDQRPAQLTLVPAREAVPGSPPLSRSPEREAERIPRASQLWLYVRLPGLAVDVLGGNATAPLAATETLDNRVVIAACNRPAEKQGVRSGMTLAAALSLCHELRSLPRDRGAECRKLNEFAAAAYCLSGAVSLYDSDGIVLEIRGSFGLLSGFEGVLHRARSDFQKLGARFVFAVAETPRAAAWLARCRPGTYVLFPGELPGMLRQLPVDVLNVEQKMLQQLDRSGIRSLGALMRLSREGVARRFGPAILKSLDQALGREPEPLVSFSPPQSFHAMEEWYPPVSDWPQISIPARALLQRLEHYLLRRQAATQRVDFVLRHERGPATVIRLNTSRYERRAEPLLDLLQRHFERLTLPGSVVGLGLHCGRMVVIPAESLHLLGGRVQVEQQWSQFLDRLIARLGRDRLWKPDARDDHRPEYASGKKVSDLFFSPDRVPGRAVNAQGGDADAPREFPPRPAWLLSQPEPLEERQGHPRWHGSLELSRMPERIEQGWWDGRDVRRDYYLARNREGARLWVFRDRSDQGWYLHGVFA